MAETLELENITNECSLSCELMCNFEHGLDIEISKQGNNTYIINHDDIPLKIHYGPEIYLIQKMHARTKKHHKIYDTNDIELVFECGHATNHRDILYIILPIKEGVTNNNGTAINDFFHTETMSTGKFEKLFPLNIQYIMYTDKDEPTHKYVVLANSSITVDSGDSKILKITGNVNNPVSEIKDLMKNTAGIKLYGSGSHKVETIECLPINDDGILLSDIEKGLGDTNISTRFNFEKIVDRLAKIPALRIIGGALSVILLYNLITVFKKKKLVGVKNMSEINK